MYNSKYSNNEKKISEKTKDQGNKGRKRKQLVIW